MNSSIINIITLLQLALSLLSNKQVQADPVMLAQANTFASQAIVLAENQVAIEAEQDQSTANLAILTPGQEAATAPDATSTDPAWTPTGTFIVNNQFALDPNVRVMATSTPSFTISGQLEELFEDSAQQTPQQWEAVTGVPLTITYGDQSETGTTDESGRVTETFVPIGVPGDHQFTYSSPGLTITDHGTVTEW